MLADARRAGSSGNPACTRLDSALLCLDRLATTFWARMHDRCGKAIDATLCLIHHRSMSGGIPYQEYVRESLRGVVPRVLRQVEAAGGAIGEHHFYITFSTKKKGVVVPTSLRAKYPDSMTIVLQHQFESLEVGDEAFSVTLRFGGAPSRLTIPYAAITTFVDPSIDFAIQFDGPPSAITGAPPSRSSRSEITSSGGSKKSRRKADKSDSRDPSDPDNPGDEDGKVVRVDFSQKR